MASIFKTGLSKVLDTLGQTASKANTIGNISKDFKPIFSDPLKLNATANQNNNFGNKLITGNQKDTEEEEAEEETPMFDWFGNRNNASSQGDRALGLNTDKNEHSMPNLFGTGNFSSNGGRSLGITQKDIETKPWYGWDELAKTKNPDAAKDILTKQSQQEYNSKQEQKATEEDAMYDAFNNVLANNSWEGMYDGYGHFITDGTRNDWYKFMTSPEARPYYQWAYDEFGTNGELDEAGFNRFWNTYKPRNIEDIYDNDEEMYKTVGTSGRGANDFSANLVNRYNYGIPGLAEFAGLNYDTEDGRQNAINALQYAIGAKVLNGMRDLGISREDMRKMISAFDLNKMFGLDNFHFGFGDDISNEFGDALDYGTISESGKTGNPITSTDLNPMALQQYKVPFTGLPDTLYDMFGDDLHYTLKTNAVEQPEENTALTNEQLQQALQYLAAQQKS